MQNYIGVSSPSRVNYTHVCDSPRLDVTNDDWQAVTVAFQFRVDLGRRIKAARKAIPMTVVEAAEKAQIARDTWTKIEHGESVLDAKLQAALDAVGITELPARESLDDASAAELREVIASVQKRVDDLSRGA